MSLKSRAWTGTVLKFCLLTACWRGGGPTPATPTEPARSATAAAAVTPLKGLCRGTAWGEVTFDLQLRQRGSSYDADGTLDFADRHTEATLHGRRKDPDHPHLAGSMTEPAGLGTRWGLELDLDVGPNGVPTRAVFREVTDDGEKLYMCTWRP